MSGFFTKLYEQPQHLIYLAVFRAYIAFHLLKKLLLQWTSLETLYGLDSFVVKSDSYIFHIAVNWHWFQANYQLLAFLYMIVLVLFAFGIGKHFTSLAVFIFVEIFQGMNNYVLNGGDNLLKFQTLYMVFCDSYQYLSFSKLKFKSDVTQKISNMLTNLAVCSIIIHLALVYFTTGLHKAHADVWFNGVATYYTLSLERFAGTEYNALFVKNGYFVTLTTYFTLLWELSFAFVAWYKKLRPYVLLCGVMLHLGIYIFMMIHDFQILYIMTYGFFFTDNEIRSFTSRVQTRMIKLFGKISGSRQKKSEYTQVFVQ
jgi:hypothetical protein